jgi:hypothetical protein
VVRFFKFASIISLVVLLVRNRKVRRILAEVLEDVRDLSLGLKVIDDSLYQLASKNIVSAAEISDVLLDVRQIILLNMPTE